MSSSMPKDEARSLEGYPSYEELCAVNLEDPKECQVVSERILDRVLLDLTAKRLTLNECEVTRFSFKDFELGFGAGDEPVVYMKAVGKPSMFGGKVGKLTESIGPEGREVVVLVHMNHNLESNWPDFVAAAHVMLSGDGGVLSVLETRLYNDDFVFDCIRGRAGMHIVYPDKSEADVDWVAGWKD